jgi:hypothetical protein
MKPAEYDPATDPEAMLAPREAAAFLSLTPRTLEAWRNRGEGPPHYRPSVNRVRYRRADLIAWMNAHRVEPRAA